MNNKNSTNNDNAHNTALTIQSNHSGVSFILILDGCIFILGLLILFCCLRNLRLWKRKKALSNSVSNSSSQVSSATAAAGNENVIVRFFKRLIQFILFESEYERISKLYGQEVSVYLWYSHQLILFTGVCTVIGLSVLLPLHLTGQVTNSNTLSNNNIISNTISNNGTNLETSSFLYKTSVNMVLSLTDRLYAHVTLFYLFSILIFYLIFRFLNSKFVNQFTKIENNNNSGTSSSELDSSTGNNSLNMISNYTVLLKDVQLNSNNENLNETNTSNSNNNSNSESSNLNLKFRKLVESIFPNLAIYSARLVNDTSHRIELQEQIEQCTEQIKHYEHVVKNSNKHVKLIKLFESNPSASLSGGGGGADSASSASCCGKVIERVDALKYWNGKKMKLEETLKMMKNVRNGEKEVLTGYGHVIFKSIKDAAKCKAMDETGNRLFKVNEFAESPTNMEISGGSFKIEQKTYEPQDLNWRNFSLKIKSQRTFRILAVNCLLIFFLLFFTSPLAIVSSLQSILNRIPQAQETFSKIKSASGFTGDLLFHYLPTLLLFVVTQLLPMVIPLLTRFEKYRAFSEEGRMILLRLFVYVVLSTLVLPVLLLTSLDGVIRYFEQFSNSVSDKLNGDSSQSGSNWQSLFDYLFLPQSGAFFINYAIQYALLGCFVDMIRLKDLIVYFYLRFKGETEEEKENATKIAEFDLPLEYGYMISFFGIILTFSVFVPLILPIGFFYFIVKHLIDRYNISRLCSKNDKALYKLSPDITSYRERNKLIVQMTCFCIVFAQFYVTLFFAKTADITFIHLFLMCLLLIASCVGVLYWNLNYKTRFNPLLGVSESNNALNNHVDEQLLIQSTYYNREEELSIFNNQLEDKFSYAYFAPYALEEIEGLKEQREQEIKDMRNQL